MIDYRLWKNKLSTDLNGRVKKVGFSSDINTVLKNVTSQKSAVFVIPNSERSVDKSTTKSTSSETTYSVDILIAAFDYSDVGGEKTNETIRDISLAVRSSLHGWRPEGAWSPVVKRSAKRVGFKNKLLLWAVTYEVKYLED